MSLCLKKQWLQNFSSSILTSPPPPKNHALCMRSMASNRRLSFANDTRDPSRVLSRQILTSTHKMCPLASLRILFQKYYY